MVMMELSKISMLIPSCSNYGILQMFESINRDNNEERTLVKILTVLIKKCSPSLTLDTR